MQKKTNSAVDNVDNIDDFEKAFNKKKQRKMKKRKAKSGKQRTGIIFIITGAVIMLYFLWINYYGVIYHEVYSFIYEHFYEGKVDEYSVMFSIDDIPDFLIAGSSLLPDNENPAMAGIPPHTETEREIEEVTSEDTTAETTKAPETTARVKVPLVMPKVSSSRSEYSGGIFMSVPRLGLSWSQIHNGTDTKALGRGPGMYDISDIPTEDMEADLNLIVAGHRDGVKANFYNLHKMKSGDLIYVYMNNLCYTYEYEETLIVESNDWSVTSRRGYSCITLTSCHPIGANSQRIVVFGKLIKIQEYRPYV